MKIIKTILTAAVIQLGLISTSINANVIEKEKIQIDIISDVVCPWCAIGYKRLSTAVEELNMEDKVNIIWHPFQLNPTMPKEGINANTYISKKMNLTPEKLIEKRKMVAKTAKDSGFEFNYFEEMKKPNTFNSHILLDYAKEYDKQTELKIRLQKAYFTEKKNIGEIDVLYKELEAVGLNAEEGIKRIDDPLAIARVESEESSWKEKGVHSIPTMVFDDMVARQGARSVESYKKLLLDLVKYKEAQKLKI